MSNKVKDALEKLIALCQEQPEKAEIPFETNLTWTKNMQSKATIRDFPSITIDVPPFLGGNNEGPAPPEFLLTSIAACFADVLAGFAAVKGVKIDSIDVSVSGQIDLRGFLGLDDKVCPGFKEIKITAKVKTDEDPEKVKELMDTAQQMAPVLDTITRKPELKFEKILNDIKFK